VQNDDDILRCIDFAHPNPGDVFLQPDHGAPAAAARAGFELGAKFASPEAAEMGVPLYLRLGYGKIIRYRNYWPRGFAYR